MSLFIASLNSEFPHTLFALQITAFFLALTFLLYFLPSPIQKKTMKTHLPLPIVPFLLFLLHCIPAFALIDPTSFASEAPSPTVASLTTEISPVRGDAEFIRASCETTQYPELCYNSLSGYANAVQQDPGRLARVAIGVSLSRARNAATHFNNLSKEADYGAAEPRVASALHDCFSVFGDAVDQIKDSLLQMRQLRTGGSRESFRFQMSNVQTWMSAALTNEDTCTDGFEDVPDGPTKTDVSDHVRNVVGMTSNALALVNSFVSKVSTP